MSSTLQLYTFSPAWGLPTSGPFGLKLEACLRMLRIPYERRFENDTRKGPKRKSPWIVDGDVRMGDTEWILAYLEKRHGRALDTHLSRAARAQSLVVRRALEEHFHQAFEYELVHDDRGIAFLQQLLNESVPKPFAALAGHMMRSAFKKHLFERGIARHAPEEIASMGKADVDALTELLGDREWFCGDQPSKVDASAFGLLAVAIRSELPSPVCSYARSQEPLVRFVDRALEHWFPDSVAGAALASNARSKAPRAPHAPPQPV